MGPCWALPDLRQDVDMSLLPSSIPSPGDLSGDVRSNLHVSVLTKEQSELEMHKDSCEEG